MYINATVPNGEAVSAWINVGNINSSERERLAIVGVFAPTGTTQTSCSIQGSWTGPGDTTGFDVIDTYGSAKTITISAGKLTDINPAQNPMVLPPYIRLKLPSTVSADREFRVGLRLV